MQRTTPRPARRPGSALSAASRAAAHQTRATVSSAARAAVALTTGLLLLTACSGLDPSSTPSATGPAPSESTETTPDSSASATTDGPDSTDPTGAAGAALSEQGVAAGHPEAVRAGTEILEQGGNAVDAAVATAFAVSVVEPFASGIGGGGVTLLAQGAEDPVAYDYRETVALDGRIPASGTGLPGFVAGMETLHAEHGSLEWSELLAPAIALAQDGFEVSPMLAQRLRTDFGPASIAGLDHFHAGGQPLAAGDTLVQSELAGTLTTLAEEGPDALYTGSLADELTAVDGLDAESLAAYEPVASDPVSGEFGEYEYVSAAPPLPGAAVVQQLQLAEALGVAGHEPGSAGYVDRMSTAWIAAQGSVHAHFGDPAFVDVPVDRLTDPEANAEVARSRLAPALAAGTPRQAPVAVGAGVLRSAPAEPVDADAPVEPLEAGNTTHVTVVDDEGRVVSMTNTITSFWGGADSEYAGGFFLNNQLSRFGALDTDQNQPEPGHKSVSWSAPALVRDDEGRVVLGLGSPGGQAIPSILASVAVPWALQDVDLQEAVDAPRSYLLEGVLTLESQPSAEVSALMQQRGWAERVTTRAQAVFGSVQALEVNYDDGSVTEAVDSRREGAAEVIPAG